MNIKKKTLQEKNPYLVVFAKPYLFEDVEHTSLDLSKLDELGAAALLAAEHSWTLKGNGSSQMETSYSFCFEVAAIATGQPAEYFDGLPMKEGIAVKGVVQKHFFGLMA